MFRGIFEIKAENGMIVLPADFQALILYGSDCTTALIRCYPAESGSFRLSPFWDQSAEIPSIYKTVRMDAQGRIPVPEELLKQLENVQPQTVAVVGQLVCFELWNPRELEKVLQSEEEEINLTPEEKEVLEELGFKF